MLVLSVGYELELLELLDILIFLDQPIAIDIDMELALELELVLLSNLSGFCPVFPSVLYELGLMGVNPGVSNRALCVIFRLTLLLLPLLLLFLYIILLKLLVSLLA